MNLPAQEQCLNYFEEYKVPENIKRHCLKVQQAAVFLAKRLEQTGININVELVRAASILHDLFKMAGINDPKPNKHHQVTFTREELAMRKTLRKKFPGQHETQIAYEIFKEEFPELAQTLLNEGNPLLRKRTIEESVIHYADYRIFNNQVVLLEERFAYFKKRYPAPEGFWSSYLDYCKEEESRIFKSLKIKPEELNAVLNNNLGHPVPEDNFDSVNAKLE